MALGRGLSLLSLAALGSPARGVTATLNQRCGSRTLSTASGGQKEVVTSREGAVFSITINRPQARNAVDPKTAALLADGFREFEACSEASVAVLSGAGGTFCAGYDLKALSSQTDLQAVSNTLRRVGQGDAPMGPSRMRLSKPVIAAIEGHAVAGGLELALLADLRVVARDAVMGVFCRRFGVPLIDGGTVRLPALIGLSRAMDLILTGRAVDGEEALQMGLANRVSEPGKALKLATEMANQLAAFPQECMRADRRSAYHSVFKARSFEAALEYEFDHGCKVLHESLQGARQFAGGQGRSGRPVQE